MRIFTLLWLLLLAYVVAALVWWGLSLQKQSEQLYEKDYALLTHRTDSLSNPGAYAYELHRLHDRRARRRSQYIGEGATFFAVILIGAAVVFTTYRRKLKMSRQQTNFMLAVTHELKSPLAAVKLNLQTMQRRKLPPDKEQQLLQSSVTEADRLNDLCNKILVASQMEGSRYRPSMEPTELAALTRETIQPIDARYPDRLTLDAPEDATLPVNADRLLLQMAISNLVENALKYSPPGTPVAVSLRAEGRNACIRVADHGSGIPDEQKRLVFQKFYRLGDEATRSAKGTGLGLFITAGIARLHGGKAAVTDNKPQGSMFSLVLPLSGVRDEG